MRPLPSPLAPPDIHDRSPSANEDERLVDASQPGHLPLTPTSAQSPEPASQDAVDAASIGLHALSLTEKPETAPYAFEETSPLVGPSAYEEIGQSPPTLHEMLTYRGDFLPPMYYYLDNHAFEAVDSSTGHRLVISTHLAPALGTLAKRIHLFLWGPLMGCHWINLHSSEAITVHHVLEQLHEFLQSHVPCWTWNSMQPPSYFERIIRTLSDRIFAQYGCSLLEAEAAGKDVNVRWIDLLGRGVPFLGLVEDGTITEMAQTEWFYVPGDVVLRVVLDEPEVSYG